MAAVECVHDHVRAVCLLIILRGGGRKRDGGVGPKAPVKIVATAIDIEANRFILSALKIDSIT